MYSREGEPETAQSAFRLSGGRRAWAVSADSDTVGAMIEGEWVGRPATLDDAASFHLN